MLKSTEKKFGKLIPRETSLRRVLGNLSEIPEIKVHIFEGENFD